jgi:hypothetical protein
MSVPNPFLGLYNGNIAPNVNFNERDHDLCDG